MDERVDIPVPAAYRKSRTDEYYPPVAWRRSLRGSGSAVVGSVVLVG